MSGPALAIVVPTLHRLGPLRDVVEDVLAQCGPDDEIVVVDQSAVPAALPDPVRVVHQPTPGLPQARNRGIAETRAPIVLFLDDDVRLEPGCLQVHRMAYLDPCVGGVVGRIHEHRVRPNSRTVTNRIGPGGRVLTNLDGPGRRPIETLKGAQMSFRRRALEDAGPFDAHFAGTAFLEDADMSVRVARHGWELWYEPDAVVSHLSIPSGGVRTGDVVRTERWRFHNTGYFVSKHRDARSRLATRATFLAIACKRAVQWRRPEEIPGLIAALERGLRLGTMPSRG